MNRSICIIDDDEDVRGVMCYALEFEGIKTMAFESAPKAEEFLKTLSDDKLPALIIVDYMMPDMDGVDFIQRIFDVYPETIGSVPMALSTARISDEMSVLPKGVILLPKPLDLNNLLEIALKYLNQGPGSVCSSF